MKSFFLSLALSIQFSTFSLLRAFMKDTTPVTTVLMYVEVLKLIFCACMMGKGRLFEKTHLIIVPATCFVMMNIVSYLVVAHVPATLYVMMMQLKIPLTYTCSYCVFKEELKAYQTLAVIFICICCMNISLKGELSNTDLLYYAGMLFEILLSSLCSVYMQIMFEASKNDIWTRNVELSMLSLPVYIGINSYSHYAWTCTSVGYLFAFLGAFGGILVALTLLHCGAVAKTISAACSVIIVTVAEHVLTKTMPGIHLISFYIICILSVLLYSIDTIKKLFEDSTQNIPLLSDV